MTATNALPNLGTQQSPIALDETIEAQINVRIDWKALVLGTPAAPDGFCPTRKLSAAPARKTGCLRMDGERYVPIDLHWHFPSEHVLGRKHKSYPAEVHIVHVHRDDLHLAGQGKLDWCRIAVVGVMIKSGREPYAPMTVAADVTTASTAESEEDRTVSVRVPREAIIPSEGSAIRYRGSLTTSPYSENVTFIIYEQPMTATKKQLDPSGGGTNARPLQACNRRFCLRGHVGPKED